MFIPHFFAENMVISDDLCQWMPLSHGIALFLRTMTSLSVLLLMNRTLKLLCLVDLACDERTVCVKDVILAKWRTRKQ